MNQGLIDGIITFSILAILGLAVWAKVSQQTIAELLRDIRDNLGDKKDEAEEQIGYYG